MSTNPNPWFDPSEVGKSIPEGSIVEMPNILFGTSLVIAASDGFRRSPSRSLQPWSTDALIRPVAPPTVAEPPVSQPSACVTDEQVTAAVRGEMCAHPAVELDGHKIPEPEWVPWPDGVPVDLRLLSKGMRVRAEYDGNVTEETVDYRHLSSDYDLAKVFDRVLLRPDDARRLAEEHAPEPEPAPSDDLPGEPVEPGDLRVGDRVAFTWEGERITCTLVSSRIGDLLLSDVSDSDGFRPNVTHRGKWDGGISDVRLLERAPREDEDPAEPRTWSLPEPPEVGTVVLDRGGEAWRVQDDSAVARWSASRRRWSSAPYAFSSILRYNSPLTVATPDDLARLGIEGER